MDLCGLSSPPNEGEADLASPRAGLRVFPINLSMARSEHRLLNVDPVCKEFANGAPIPIGLDPPESDGLTSQEAAQTMPKFWEESDQLADPK